MSGANGYGLVERLGSGPAGFVYLADGPEGRVVAREFRSAAEINSPEWHSERTEFLEAGRAAMALKHPRIAPVLNVVDEPGAALIVMEHQEGPTLENVLNSRRLTHEEAIDYVQQLAMGLDFAHDRGLVHGDLKPSNVFVSGQSLKISDFGVSPRGRLLGRQPMPRSVAHEYLSPEHWRSPERVSARSDQYALAAIAYRMYTGYPPAIQAPAARPDATRLDEITPPSHADARLPAAIDGPILRALSADPNRRFDSCREFFGMLGAAFIVPPPDNRARRSRAALYAAALIPLLAIGAVVAQRMRQSGRPIVKIVEPASAKSLPGSTGGSQPGKQPHVAEPATKRSAQKEDRDPPPRSGSPGKPAGREVAVVQTPPPRTPGAGVRPVEPVESEAPAVPAAGGSVYTIEVFSRNNRIEEDTSFRVGDPILGELGQGDLKAVVGGVAPAGGRQLRLEWTVNSVIADARPVAVRQITEYGNEPTVGTYRLTLKLNGRAVRTFSFRITP